LKPEELDLKYRKELILKMAEDLADRLNKIDEKLKNLESGNVLDVSNLTQDLAKALVHLYLNKYFIRGPVEDKDNKGKYALAFIVNYGKSKNA